MERDDLILRELEYVRKDVKEVKDKVGAIDKRLGLVEAKTKVLVSFLALAGGVIGAKLKGILGI